MSEVQPALSASRYDVGQRLLHHSGQVWEVMQSGLPGDGLWHGHMVEMEGDYMIRCVEGALPLAEMRVHADYLHGDGWRRA